MLGRILRVALVLATVTGFVAAGGPATAAGTTYRVQVDGRPPKGEPWAFLRFFPGHQLTVDQGDVVEAAWDGTDTPHTATFVPTAHPEQWRADHQQPGGDFPLIVPDAAVGGDDDELVLNPSVLAPTAFDCGTSATPCNFDGSSLVNSGFQFSDPSNEPSFFAKVNAPVGQYSLLCLVHPGMEIALSVLPSGTDIPSPDEVAAETASQLKHARIVDGEAADEQAQHLAKSNLAGGHKRLTIHAGGFDSGVTANEYRDKGVTLDVGDQAQGPRQLRDPYGHVPRERVRHRAVHRDPVRGARARYSGDLSCRLRETDGLPGRPQYESRRSDEVQ
ncbi:MAG: hypothetical protein M3Q23_04515 [Actinomycetota bacterium]|nr:hypothetical protein [Actinomycetota bacterium]